MRTLVIVLTATFALTLAPNALAILFKKKDNVGEIEAQTRQDGQGQGLTIQLNGEELITPDQTLDACALADGFAGK